MDSDQLTIPPIDPVTATVISVAGVAGAPHPERASPASRAALRYASEEATAHLAYRYLARHWQEHAYLELPVRLYAALVASNHRIAHTPGRTLGGLLHTSTVRSTSIEQQLTAIQHMDLTVTHHSLRSLLPTCHGTVDWDQLWQMYRWWDQPNPERRRAHRRQILADYYQHTSGQPEPTTTDET